MAHTSTVGKYRLDIEPLGAPLLLMILRLILPGFMLFIIINMALVVFSTNSVLNLTVQNERHRVVLLFACLLAPPIVENPWVLPGAT